MLNTHALDGIVVPAVALVCSFVIFPEPSLALLAYRPPNFSSSRHADGPPRVCCSKAY